MVDYRENYYNVCCKRVILLKTLAWTRVGLLERRLGAHNHHVFSHWSACAKPGKWLSCMYVCMLRVSILPQFLLFFLFVFGTAPTVWLFVLFCYFVTPLVLLFVSWLCRVVEAFTQHNTPQRVWYSSALLFIIPTKTDHIAQLNTNVLNLQ